MLTRSFFLSFLVEYGEVAVSYFYESDCVGGSYATYYYGQGCYYEYGMWGEFNCNGIPPTPSPTVTPTYLVNQKYPNSTDCSATDIFLRAILTSACYYDEGYYYTAQVSSDASSTITATYTQFYDSYCSDPTGTVTTSTYSSSCATNGGDSETFNITAVGEVPVLSNSILIG